MHQIIEEKGISMNICAANEHVPEIKRHIRTMNERVRSTAMILPFERYPPQLIVEMVYNCVFWLNSFPHKDGIHKLIRAGGSRYKPYWEMGNSSTYSS